MSGNALFCQPKCTTGIFYWSNNIFLNFFLLQSIVKQQHLFKRSWDPNVKTDQYETQYAPKYDFCATKLTSINNTFKYVLQTH